MQSSKRFLLVHPFFTQDMYRAGKQAGRRKDGTRTVFIGGEYPDRKPAVRGEPPGDGDEPHRHAPFLEDLFRRHHLMRSPEDENDFRGSGPRHTDPPCPLFPGKGFSIIIRGGTDGRETIILSTHTLSFMGFIGATALLLNIPLGYLREGQRKFSLAWFVYVHLSVPLIAWLRIANHVTSWLIPFFILCAVAGQIVGGRVRRRADRGAR